MIETDLLCTLHARRLMEMREIRNGEGRFELAKTHKGEGDSLFTALASCTDFARRND